jgi:hypothetical protein
MGKTKMQDADRDEGGNDQLRQVLAVIRIQRFDAFDGGGGQFACALSARVGGTEFEDMVEEPFAQVGFDADGDGIRADFSDPGEEGAPRNDEQDEAEPVKYVREGLPLEEDAVYGTADEVGLANRQQTS